MTETRKATWQLTAAGMTLQELQQELLKAVEREDYEVAKIIQDEIDKRKNPL